MPLTRLDNLISSKTGRYLYVSPDDFNASDELDNRGNSPNRPFVTIQRAFIEVSRYSYAPGIDNDRFDEFTIMLMPGDHYIDNRPGLVSTSGTPVFGFDQYTNAWTDSSVVDLSNPNNVLYKFNGTEGGCIVPRGCSLIGYDLRRTIIRPLYVPDPADKEQPRTSVFNVTGGAYIWQFTIKDGDVTTKSPLYDTTAGVGKVYYRKNDNANLAIPEYSHHKITVFQYAEKDELDLYYKKVAQSFAQYQPTIDDVNEFSGNVSETRIVGPLSDLRSIESIQVVDSSPQGQVTVNVTTKIAHGYIKNQFFAVQNNGLDDALNGTFNVSSIDSLNRRRFSFVLPGTVTSLGLQNNQTYSTANGLSTGAYVQAEVDSVQSASPYMFNLSIRSTWGICGLLADGSKVTGFKSMVCAQYTGVSLQKDDRAFIRYDKYTNTWNQASLSDAFATVPYHTKGDAYWKDDWRNAHIKATNDAFIQCVSIFAVGFADHFLMESGGDMSITNSNSNFGNTSLHAKGHKGYSFNQDKGGYIDAIIPPEKLIDSTANNERIDYYTWDVQASRGSNTKLYFGGSDNVTDPKKRPAATLGGYRIGAKSNEKIYVELDPYGSGSGKSPVPDSIYNGTLTPSGYNFYPSSLQILNPTTVAVNNKDQDAANRIEDNKLLIQEETYGYITTKYPDLLTKNIIISKCQRDVGLVLDAVISDLRLGGNINTLQAAESYFTGGQLNYIDGEKFETIEGFEYARDLAIASVRNWTFLQTGCSISNNSSLVTVPTTVGLVIGMKVQEYTGLNSNNTTADPNTLTTANIPTDSYIKNIVNSTTIEIGSVVAGQRSTPFTGAAANATGTNASANLWFSLEDQNGVRKGVFSSTVGAIDANITQDTVYPQCNATAQGISTLMNNIKTTINQGINPVGDRYADAHDLLLANKNYIADVAVKDMLIEYPTHTVPGGSVNCFDDVVDIIEAVAYNVKFGSNNQVWDAANLYVVGAHLAGEEQQSIYTFRKAKQIASAIIQNVTYTPRAGVTTSYTQTKDTSITTDPSPVNAVYCADVISAMSTLFQIVEYGIDTAGLTSQALGTFTPTGATYDGATGDMTLTMAGHGLSAQNKIGVDTAGITFTCSMDSHGSNHAYPRVGDPAYKNNIRDITNITADTVTFNVGTTPLVGHNITNSTYNPANGDLVLSIGAHNISTGDTLQLEKDALEFTCTQDGNATVHSYPRTSDPAYNTAVAVSAVEETDHTPTDAAYNPVNGELVLTVASHGFKARSTHTPTDAAYNPTTGILTLTVANHQFATGTSVILANNSITFTCAKDGNATNHSYPRATDPASNTKLPIQNITGNTFDVQIGISSDTSVHTFVSAGNNSVTRVGSMVKLVNDSLTFTCAKDSNTSNHSYPRATDEASLEWLEITTATNDTFLINVSPSPDTSIHNFVSASAGAVKKQTGVITVAVGATPEVTYTPTAATFTPTTGEMVLTIGSHTLSGPSTHTATDAAYDPATGILTSTVANHGFSLGDRVRIADDSFTFTCAEDSNATNHTYPRASDPASGKWLPVLNVTANTFDVQILTTVPSTNVTAHTFVSAAADAITLAGESVKIADNSLTFTCGQDSHGTNHTYPRTSDPASDTSLPILASTGTTITVDVGTSSNTTAHTFVSALGSSVSTGGNYTHTFVRGKQFAVKAGGAYTHTFVSAVTDSVTAYSNNAGQFAATTKSTPTPNAVPRTNPSTSTDQFAQRSSLFTVDAGGTNPHKFETGTPVRLVARAKAGKTPDERDIRLPLGFQPNRAYYVIAPGRNTQPFNYNDAAVYSGIFDGSDQTKLMLAESPEAAAAGIYIYSPETESLDDDVEILIEQYVLDTTYDLHEYRVGFNGSSGTVFKTEVAHIFDKPTNGIPAAELQKIFFRDSGSDGQTGVLPTISGGGGSQVSSTQEYYVRYETEDTFKIFATAQDAITGAPEVVLVNNPAQSWYVFANKRTSPMRFDPTFVDTSSSRIPTIPDGLWYLNLKDETSLDDNIITRIQENDYDPASGQTQTTDSYYTRLKDDRKADDRIYRLRYVQPKDYPGSVREPNNGFVMKIRTDTKRNLIPQNITLEKVGGSPDVADFRNPQSANSTESLGMTKADFDDAVQAGTLSAKNVYDPDNYALEVNTDNYIRFSIRSARQIGPTGSKKLQLTVSDLTVDDTNAPNLKNTVFHTVEINAPQAGAFAVSKTQSSPTNIVEWTGGSSGVGYIHAYFMVGSKHYIILKDVSARPTYNSLVNTRFQQGSVYADQQSDVNSGRDSKSNNLYVVGDSNVFTITPGDTMNDSVGNTYTVSAVEDVKDIDDTFYIFESETIQSRVSGQQDGIYYLTAVRGNISPLPRGAGVGGNFQNFKFSQPISSLYPLDYKNDPTWYQVIDNNGTKDTLITDPPAANSFADNYTHGLVWVNDYKRSMTKETIEDLTQTGYFSGYSYTGNNGLQALTGNATAGSEQRKLPIAGDAASVHDQKVYIELRRPSIARSGNHTFEYLGFGPGNYSSGLPARQEVILSEFQDYYAQAKREDGGIVFYTGLNSNGDLYIGNKKIDAITGEETFLEKAVLSSSEDDTDIITTLVTSFDTPVTFKDKITVEGVGYFNNRVIISTQPPTEVPSLSILANPRSDGGAEDVTLTRGNWADRNQGDITISRNKISTAIYHIKGRGTALFPGQEYSIRTNFSYAENEPSNRTPYQGSSPSPFDASQFVRYYNSSDVAANPQAGDILYKGKSIEKSGSLGWIYANYYSAIPEGSILQLLANGSNTLQIHWSGAFINSDSGINISVGKTIRIQGFSDPRVNGKWVITKADQTGADNGFCEFVIANSIATTTFTWNPTLQPTAILERSDESWKETGVIGSQAIRTETDSYGQFKLGVNTIARTAHAAHEYAFLTYTAGGVVYNQQEPRANLDVVGNTFISGKAINNYIGESTTTKTETGLTDALIVGGDSITSDNLATLRVSTAATRVGINATNTDLDATLTIKVGSGETNALHLVTVGNDIANADIDGNVNIDGGSITTNATTFNVLDTNATTLNIGGAATNVNLFEDATSPQTINVGTSSTDTTLNVHTSSTDSTINIGTVVDGATNKSIITVGGAFSNTANSTLTVKNAQTILDGDLDVNGGDLQSNSQTINLFTRAGAGSIVNFATRASQFAIGGVAGTTEVRNSLKVNGDTDMYGDVTMHGGSNSGTVTVDRQQLNTSQVAHASGSLQNLNVDFYKYVSDIDNAQVITSVAANGVISVNENYFLNGNTVQFTDITGLSGGGITVGATYFVISSSGSTFQISLTEGGAPVQVGGTPGTSAGITLQNTLVDTGTGTTQWTDNSSDAEYNRLPVNNVRGIEIGDILIINTELVEVVSPGADANTRIVPVTRGIDCTTVSIHADNDVIYKLERSNAATYLVGRVPQSSTTPTLSNLVDNADTLEVPINDLGTGDAVNFTNVGSIVGVNTTSTYFVVNAVNDTGNSVTRFNLSLDPDGGAVPISGSVGSAILNFSANLVSLAEFGGQFSVGDYLRLNGANTPSCTGEFVKITAVNDTNAEKFSVNNGAQQDRFVIDSVFGGVDSTIIGAQDFSINLTGNASTNSTDNQFRIINGQPTANTRLTIDSDGKFTVVGIGTEAAPKAIIDKGGNEWLAGNLRVQNDGAAGSADDAKMALYLQASTGNLEISGHLQIDDDFSVFSGTTGVQFPTTDSATLHVDAQTGDTRIGVTGSAIGTGDLTVNGGQVTINSLPQARTSADNTKALEINGLGNSGDRLIRVRQDAAIDAFGVDRYFGKNGGLNWEFKSSDATLETGKNYFVAVAATAVFTLPADAETGDMIRMIDLGGNLSYSTSLIVRAPVGVQMQGDATGTLAGGLSSAYQGGEMIVQTRNAGFGFVFAGAKDGTETGTIPSNYRGWWLVEL